MREFITYEDSITRLNATLRISGRDAENLERDIQGLGRSTVFTAEQVAQAATFLGQILHSVNRV